MIPRQTTSHSLSISWSIYWARDIVVPCYLIVKWWNSSKWLLDRISRQWWHQNRVLNTYDVMLRWVAPEIRGWLNSRNKDWNRDLVTSSLVIKVKMLNILSQKIACRVSSRVIWRVRIVFILYSYLAQKRNYRYQGKLAQYVEFVSSSNKWTFRYWLVRPPLHMV